MITGTARRAGATATASVILIGAAILRGSTAAADPNQDDQFLALLDQHGIPALENPPSLIATAQRVCHELDGGMSFEAVVESMTTFAANNDPGKYPRDRLSRTFTRFVTAAVQAYCPYNQGKLASFAALRAPRPSEPTYRVAAYTRTAGGGVFVASPLHETLPVGETVAPQPPPIPAQSPPPAHIVIPPRAPVPPQPPKQPPPVPQQPPPTPQELPPPPQEPPPPPQQVEPPPPQQVEPPPVTAPQPGSGAGGSGIGGDGGAGSGGGGSGGGGGGGGRGPAAPAPTRPMPPGVVQIAP